MKQAHMRPQDVAILLKIIALEQRLWRHADLANLLFISQAEISESLFRSFLAGLIDDSRKKVHKRALYDFLVYGVRYAFPQRPGAIVRGMPTAHSAPPLADLIRSSTSVYVWPDEEGTIRGEAIEPLYATVPKAAKCDATFYELMATVDGIRVGKAREREIATRQLKRGMSIEE